MRLRTDIHPSAASSDLKARSRRARMTESDASPEQRHPFANRGHHEERSKFQQIASRSVLRACRRFMRMDDGSGSGSRLDF